MKNMSVLPAESTVEILSLLQEFTDEWNSKNLESFGKVFTDDVEYTDIAGQIARGKAAVVDQHRFPFAVVNKLAVLKLNDVYLRPVDEHLVLATGTWTCENSTTPAGDLLPMRWGVMQVICRFGKNEWKISLVHNTDLSQAYKGLVNTELRFYQSAK